MPTIEISVINASTVVTDETVSTAVGALQTQVSEHFAPAWGIDATITFVPAGGTPRDGTWWLAILDNSDQAGALGYHDVTTDGLPLGKVFAGSDLQYGYNWTVTASHELLEMLADPDINLTAFVQKTNTAGLLYAYEVCDACEADEHGYDIAGTLVSDFVFPSWFESFRGTGTKFDYRSLISQPFDLLPGGYIGIFDVTNGSGWKQQHADTTDLKYSARPHVGSRRERRRTPREEWQHSRQDVMELTKAHRSRERA